MKLPKIDGHKFARSLVEEHVRASMKPLLGGLTRAHWEKLYRTGRNPLSLMPDETISKWQKKAKWYRIFAEKFPDRELLALAREELPELDAFMEEHDAEAWALSWMVGIREFFFGTIPI